VNSKSLPQKALLHLKSLEPRPAVSDATVGLPDSMGVSKLAKQPGAIKVHQPSLRPADLRPSVAIELCVASIAPGPTGQGAGGPGASYHPDPCRSAATCRTRRLILQPVNRLKQGARAK